MCAAAAVAIDLTDVEQEQDQQVEGQAIGHEAGEAEAGTESENNVVDSVVDSDAESETTETTDEEPPATTRAEPTTTQEPPATSTFEHDLLVQIRDQESRVSTAEYSLNRAKEEVKECREAFDGEVATMRRLIRQREEKHPLFDSQPVTVAEVVKVDESEQAAPATTTRNPDDNSWRDEPIENLNIPETLVGKLMQAGIEDIGGLADWSSSGKRLIDIAGVGAAKATKIEEAMDEFWKTWQWAASEREEVAEVAGEEADVATDEATDEATEE